MACDVLGVGITRHGRGIGAPSVLAQAAAADALADAGLTGNQLDLVLVGNALGGALHDQANVRGEVWLRGFDIGGAGIVNVDNSCAASSTAFHVGAVAAAAGMRVLVIGVEEMTGNERAATIAAIEQGLDPASRAASAELAGGIGTPIMAVNAFWARRFLDRHDESAELYADVAVKARSLAAANPIASIRSVTADEVMASRIINPPLHLLMCSSFTDGASAIVLGPSTSNPRAGSIGVRTTQLISGDGTLDYHDRLKLGADALWNASGIGPRDVDVVELHDATSGEELWACEQIGLYREDEVVDAFRAGATMPTPTGGLAHHRVAVNPSGGLVGRGHPIGATGTAQIVELVLQLRGECGTRQADSPRLAAGFNTGGITNTDCLSVCATLLERR